MSTAGVIGSRFPAPPTASNGEEDEEYLKSMKPKKAWEQEVRATLCGRGDISNEFGLDALGARAVTSVQPPPPCVMCLYERRRTEDDMPLAVYAACRIHETAMAVAWFPAPCSPSLPSFLISLCE